MVLVGRVLVLFFGTLAAPLAAQDSVLVVPDAPACATYSLTVSAVVELGDREGPGIVAQLNAPYAPARVVRSHDGDYYVSALGAGRTPAPILTRRGLSGCDWAARRGNGRVRLAGTVGGVADEPDQAGQPLHLYDEPSGRVTHSFGGEGVRSFQAGQPPTEVRRRVAPAADGQIRAASWNRYRIDKRSPNGDCIIRIEHDAPWFRPWEEGPGLPREFEPLPVILGVRDWGDGLLMVVVNVADAEWTPLPPARVVRGHELTSAAQYEQLFDTMIEVLDTRSGSALLS